MARVEEAIETYLINQGVHIIIKTKGEKQLSG